MTLGLAREKLDQDPERARALMDEAHAEAKAAMTELRAIARGIHPAILDDRGLDAALSALAARSPVPVAITVRLAQRESQAVEGAAYYVVAEALTNIAKHADATEGRRRRVRCAEGTVVVRVSDDGKGGAALRPDGGLAGLADRVAALGGALRIESPTGGPTTLTAELAREPDRASKRVVIAEDSVLLRAGIARLLDDAGDQVVAAVDNAELLLAAVAEHLPDICVVDVRMPPTFTDEGIRAAVEIRRRHPRVAVLVLSQYVEERYATDLLADGQAGGVGYLLKDRVADVREFVDALHRVAGGGTALDPEVVSQLFARRRRTPGIDQLTPRETEVLQLMAEGRSNGGIADGLVVSAGAVEKHVNNIFAKLGLTPDSGDHRRVLAVLKYLEGGR